MFKKNQKILTKAERRIANTTTHDLVLWANSTIYAIGRGLAHQEDTPVNYDEMVDAAGMLLLVTKELQARG